MQKVSNMKRRPKICEQKPPVVPPAIAPRLATTWVTVTRSGEKSYSFVSRVGYRSWEPCA